MRVRGQGVRRADDRVELRGGEAAEEGGAQRVALRDELPVVVDGRAAAGANQPSLS